jgi:hypothetical protein
MALITEQIKLFKLIENEPESALWQRQKTFLQMRLTDLSLALERRNLAPVDAEYYRGQISLIREILSAEGAKNET